MLTPHSHEDAPHCQGSCPAEKIAVATTTCQAEFAAEHNGTDASAPGECDCHCHGESAVARLVFLIRWPGDHAHCSGSCATEQQTAADSECVVASAGAADPSAGSNAARSSAAISVGPALSMLPVTLAIGCLATLLQ
jgi:hypothetical protein